MRAGNKSTISTLLLLALLIAAFVWHALFYLFVQDDAYIFFRYAENWVNGLGPVWNAGERVEGYSSPAWLAVLTLLRAVFGAFEPGVHLITIGLGIATLVLVFTLAKAWTGSIWGGLAAGVLTAMDRTFAVWSTSGMETRMFGLAVLAMIALAWRVRVGPFHPALGFGFGIAVLCVCLTRPEGILFAGIMLGYSALTSPSCLRKPSTRVGLVACAVGLVAHLAWRWVYYGSLVPNTFFAKISGVDLSAGAAFFWDFSKSYTLFSAGIIVAMVWHLAAAVQRREPTFCLALVGLCTAYFGYLLAIGGGFMEFRFLDVTIPIVALLQVSALWSVCAKLKRPMATVVAVALTMTVATTNLNAGITFEDSRHEVLTHTEMWEKTTLSWIAIGKWFKEIALPGESIATTAAGAIPFFSQLRCLDMHGLSDPYIAHLPASSGNVGHLKVAPEEYISEQGITFVIDHPKLFTRPELARLPENGFYMRLDVGPETSLFLVTRTTGDRQALLSSLSARGVTVVSR